MNLSWDFWEPILGWLGFVIEMTAVISALAYFVRSKRSEMLRRKSRVHRGYAVIAISFGHDIAKAVRDQYGWDTDLEVNPEVILGKLIIDDVKDYNILIKKVRDFVKYNQDKEIRIFSSAPLGFNGVLGQSLGIGYDIVWYQYDLSKGKYSPAPSVRQVL